MNTPKPHISYTLGKAEKLCSEKIITGLFQPGFFVSAYPLRINIAYNVLPPAGVPAQVVFSVSKRRFKHAPDRNRVKRLMREVYRLNKHSILQALEERKMTAALALIYTGDKLPSFAALQVAFSRCADKLIQQIHAQ